MYWLPPKTRFHASQILRIIWLVISSNQTYTFIKEKSSCMMWIFFGWAILISGCADSPIRHYVQEVEMLCVLEACHSSALGGHHSGIRTAHKILQCGYYWPTIHQDAHEFSKACDRCERDGGISIKQQIHLNPILVIELFDVWSIDFMGPFVSSNSMKYILVAVEYVSTWVKAIALANNEGKSVTAFLKKNIFARFGTPRAFISDWGIPLLQQAI